MCGWCRLIDRGGRREDRKGCGQVGGQAGRQAGIHFAKSLLVLHRLRRRAADAGLPPFLPSESASSARRVQSVTRLFNAALIDGGGLKLLEYHSRTLDRF